MDTHRRNTVHLILKSNYFLKAMCLLKLVREKNTCVHV